MGGQTVWMRIPCTLHLCPAAPAVCATGMLRITRGPIGLPSRPLAALSLSANLPCAKAAAVRTSLPSPFLAFALRRRFYATDLDDLSSDIGAAADETGARARAARLRAKKIKGKAPDKFIPKSLTRPPKLPNARHLEETRQIRLRYQVMTTIHETLLPYYIFRMKLII